MSRNARLSCSCGEVRGLVTAVSPNTVNRVVCYCDDCQAFLHHLGRAELLDAQGGTDIIQIAPASLSFVQGEERIVGLRLGPKGLYRWYASCCRTPVGNTVGPAIPFVGVVAQAFESQTQKPDNLFGRPIGRIYGKYAVGSAPKGSTWLSPWLMARAIRMVLGWRRTDLAASVLRADAARAQISGDNPVPRRAGGAAPIVRSAPIGPSRDVGLRRFACTVFSPPTTIIRHLVHRR
jgi:hypothetical protein